MKEVSLFFDKLQFSIFSSVPPARSELYEHNLTVMLVRLKLRLKIQVKRACNKHTYVLHEQRELELDFVFISTHHGHCQLKYRLNEHVISTHTCARTA
ncbi:hypothetical protein PUN28_003683 [Cardiocondyla obscurior]|uniref:Uncharacterized protein n=1 Tax=Cardiocondyla obscurior TaxID=286306 RepID=A0AAW2GJW0_9HYME